MWWHAGTISQSVSHYHTPSRELMAHTLTLKSLGVKREGNGAVVLLLCVVSGVCRQCVLGRGFLV